jgi:hypothetical protein
MITKQVIAMVEMGVELVEELSNIQFCVCGH